MVSKHTIAHKQLKIRTDMNSDAPYESAVQTSLIPLHGCAAIKKKSLWFQSIPLAKWTIYASILK
jgi:hypothetical protein